MDIKIHYLAKAYDEPPPLSLVDPILTDNGVQGARLAIADNNKSGAFLGQKYELIEDLLPADGDVVAKAKEILSKGPAIWASARVGEAQQAVLISGFVTP